MGVLTLLRKLSLLYVTATMFVVMSFVAPEFLTLFNVFTILRHTSIMGILAIGLTLVIVSGEFDISFAAIATFSGVVMSFIVSGGVNLYASWLIGAGLGLLLGFVNAILVLRARIPAFVATLGMMTILDGLSDHLCRGQYYVDYSWPANFGLLGQKYTFNVVPNPFIVLAIVLVVFIVVLEYTRTGRYSYAVGGNPRASSYVGISVFTIKRTAFLVAGLLSGLAGILTASELGCVEPLMDNAYQMPAITAVFLGSIFLRDGVPNIWGTFIAALLLIMITSGLNLMGYSQWLITMFEGIILLVAVGFVAGLKKGTIPTLKIG